MLTTPDVYADVSAPIPPVSVDPGNAVDPGEVPIVVDMISTMVPILVELVPPVVHFDMVEPGTIATDPVPDPNAPQAVPYISIEPDMPAAEVATSAQKTDCWTYGTARGIRVSDGLCPPPHWKGGTWYVEDHTGAGWPVHNAVDYWNSSGSGMRVVYGCPANKYHCVKIVEGKYGDTRWYGNTSISPVQAGTHDFTGVSIQFNDSYAMTTSKRVMCVVHELGHAAGLDHEAANVSAMWYLIDGKHTTASGDDFSQLRLHHYNNPSI